LLEKSSSRKIFKRVKDDSPSLYVHRDTASFHSRCTDNLSKISMVFAFDRELFLSDIYERVLRGSLKESLRRQQADVKSTKTIDLALKAEERRQRRECKVLVLGGPESGAETLMKQMKIHYGYSTEELFSYRDVVRSGVLKAMRAVMEHLRGIELDDKNMNYVKIILQETEESRASVTETTLAAMKSLWDSPEVRSFIYEAVAGDQA